MMIYDDFYNNSSCHAMNVLTTTTGSTTNQKAFSLHQNSFTTTVYIIYICCEQKHIDIIYTFMYKNSYFNTKSCIYYHYLYFKVLKIS